MNFLENITAWQGALVVIGGAMEAYALLFIREEAPVTPDIPATPMLEVTPPKPFAPRMTQASPVEAEVRPNRNLFGRGRALGAGITKTVKMACNDLRTSTQKVLINLKAPPISPRH